MGKVTSILNMNELKPWLRVGGLEYSLPNSSETSDIMESHDELMQNIPAVVYSIPCGAGKD